MVTALWACTNLSWAADAPARTSRFNHPHSLATDQAGNIYVADTFNQSIRKITPAGAVTTLPDTAGNKDIATMDDRATREARLGLYNHPFGIAADAQGQVYIADTLSHTIRKITTAGVITTLAGERGVPGSTDGTGNAARFNEPMAIAVDKSGNLYVADTANEIIRKITPTGLVSTIAGGSGRSGTSDGTGADARFGRPSGIATDSSGNVYVSDTKNNTIRKITPAGVVTTLAGTAGTPGGDDGMGKKAGFFEPAQIAVDKSGNLFVTDSEAHNIRKITPAGLVTTLAGQFAQTGSRDAVGEAAQFNYPRGIATDQQGNVYVADTKNNTIRKITPNGTVSTLAGAPGECGFAPNPLPIWLAAPTALCN